MGRNSKSVEVSTAEFADGERVITEIDGVEVAVFNVEGDYYATLNYCPHQGGPLCDGSLTGTCTAQYDREALETHTEWVKEGKIINCPWHGWEFDVTTGECLLDDDIHIPTYEVDSDGERITVELG